MSFSLKHLLLFTLVAAVGLAAFLNPHNELSRNVVNLLVVVILVISAYRIWITRGAERAFHIGFVCWCGLYFVDFTRNNLGIELGISNLISLYWYDVLRGRDFALSDPGGLSRLNDIGHGLFALLLGLIGGWVTVYFYRKRKQMTEKPEQPHL